MSKPKCGAYGQPRLERGMGALRGAVPRARADAPSPVFFEKHTEVVKVEDVEEAAAGWPLAVTLSDGRWLLPPSVPCRRQRCPEIPTLRAGPGKQAAWVA